MIARMVVCYDPEVFEKDITTLDVRVETYVYRKSVYDTRRKVKKQNNAPSAFIPRLRLSCRTYLRAERRHVYGLYCGVWT
jgi:hypothetical protein